jgi:soluble lytic murein transglycosylase-like protein
MANAVIYPAWPARNSYVDHRSLSFIVLIALLLSVFAFAVSLHGRPHRTIVVEARKEVAAPVPAPTARKVVEPKKVVERRAAPEPGRVRAMASYLGKRYYVSTEATQRLVETAFAVGHEVKLDPLLILAVMAVESRFNPIAESMAGAQGLMQVIPKYHADKVPDTETDASFLDPDVNVLVGAKVLKEYITRSGGNLQSGLQRYNGASSDASAQYANKVMAEKERLRQVFSRRARGAT